MILKPNDSTSVYKDNTGQAQDHDSDAIYPEDQGITYPLHFEATLKQDGNIAIEPENLKPPVLSSNLSLITLWHRLVMAVPQ